jgi:hypothetical protein
MSAQSKTYNDICYNNFTYNYNTFDINKCIITYVF